MADNVIPFPSTETETVSDDQVVHCQDCGRPATCISPNRTPLCDVCAEGTAGWCDLCDYEPAAGLSPTPSIPEGTDEPWALCTTCWH